MTYKARGIKYELSLIYSYLNMQSQELIIILLQRINEWLMIYHSSQSYVNMYISFSGYAKPRTNVKSSKMNYS